MIKRLQCLLLSGCLAATGLAAQTTVSIDATRDNTLYESQTGNVSNGGGDVLFTGVTNNGDLRRAILAFDDLSMIPAGVEIVDISLGIRVTKTISGSDTFTLHRVLADWGEGDSVGDGNAGAGVSSATDDATWIHRFFPDTNWNNPGGDFVEEASATFTLNDNGDYLVESTPAMLFDVVLWLADPDQNFGWVIVGDESATPPNAKRLSSREGVSAPVLNVTYQIPPIDIALLTGLWFDPLLDGEGYVVFIVEGGILVHYFGFDSEGNRLWLISEVFGDEFNLGDTITMNMIVADEGSFTEPAAPDSFEVYGTLEARFDMCGEGQFILDGRDGVKNSMVTKLARLAGADC